MYQYNALKLIKNTDLLSKTGGLAPGCGHSSFGILSHICAVSGLAGDFGDANGPRLRRARRLRARHLAIYLGHIAFGLSQKALALAFGRDRSTIRYVCARIEDRRDDRRFDRALDALEVALRCFFEAFHVASRGVSAGEARS